ncbi:hypothetical protein BN59_00922 [Legionella massiliensis]|uniref:Dot/Icm T4SS effector n=1 Tax=Legionella massiliensis TaxID=1034943 RepID=A0A078KY31_9GAMM|nr:hypothetical protein [Legionella massiliensis]CDZ76648.1 hypothetical protein BN59_00922 [Legionella massiliensis]CEE12386.1 hypothetical protein BN1094_00922 [Legionella massiliensis]
MPKKVAFVDIDGCLVENGKLNQALVEQLKAYDEVILFTQRSKFLQVGQVSRPYILAEQVPAKEEIINTPDAVQALSTILGKPIKVSTSVDRFFGNPTEYYESRLKDFEERLKEEASSKGDQVDIASFNLEVRTEVEKIRAALGQDERKSPGDFYPQGKVEQCQELINHLPQLMGTSDFVIDYYDDSQRNLKEVIDTDFPNKPTCMIVSGSYSCPLTKFKEKYGNEADPRDPEIKKQLENDPIAKLNQYIVDRERERQTSKSEYKSKWAEIFTPINSATTKISAAKKAIKILQGDDGEVMTEDEMQALKQGRLKEIIGDEIKTIKDSQEEQQDRSCLWFRN